MSDGRQLWRTDGKTTLVLGAGAALVVLLSTSCIVSRQVSIGALFWRYCWLAIRISCKLLPLVGMKTTAQFYVGLFMPRMS